MSVSEHPTVLSVSCSELKHSAEDGCRTSEPQESDNEQSVAEVEASFLTYVNRFGSFNVEYYPVKSCSSKNISLGVTPLGLFLQQDDIIKNTFSWSKVAEISFKKRHFFIQLKASEIYQTVLAFYMGSCCAAKSVWRCSVKRHRWYLQKKQNPINVRDRLLFCRSPGVCNDQRKSSSKDIGVDPQYERELICYVRHNGSEASISKYYDFKAGEDNDYGPEGTRIQLEPDSEGQFGFKVCGGSGSAVFVSWVASNQPYLIEGHQVLSINGTEVDELTHEQIVQMIRSTTGELTLLVKPQVREPEGDSEFTSKNSRNSTLRPT